MNFKISFQSMEHSVALENYARKKCEKINDLLQNISGEHNYEFHLCSHPNHAHQEVTISLHAKDFRLNTSAEGLDSYDVIDNAVDKLIVLVKKEKEKIRDFHRKGQTEKRKNEI